MDIFPVWRTTYYDTVEDSITFRITNDDGEEIYRARADRRPDEDIMRINLNKPCQNALDSMLSGWNGESDTVVPQNAYMVFHLQFPDGDGWETVYSFAFVNDWSYEDHQGNEYSEPINGHAAPGQILTYSYLVTGDSETICYDFNYHGIVFIITEGNGALFPQSGGTWDLGYWTSLDSVEYKLYDSFGHLIETGVTLGSDRRLSISIPGGISTEYNIYFYDPQDESLVGQAIAYKHLNYNEMYLTLLASSGGTVVWRNTNASGVHSVEYSINGGEWTTGTYRTSLYIPETGLTFNLNEGDYIQFRNQSGKDSVFSGSTAVFSAFGNAESLYDPVGFPDTVHANSFLNMFAGTNITSARNLILPGEFTESGGTPSSGITYGGMFDGCGMLTEPPELPATTLGIAGVYDSMFRGCSSLATAPALPATALSTSCYHAMFMNCSSLTTPPVLPATTLAYECYHSMFMGCTALATAPALPATTLEEACYYQMFKGCTSLRKAPVLLASTLEDRSYSCMFMDCTLLDYIKCTATYIVPRDTQHTGSVNGWTSNVSPTGTFVKDPSMYYDPDDYLNSDWKPGSDGIPEGWTVLDA